MALLTPAVTVRDAYTNYPRTLLWLVRGGTLRLDPAAGGAPGALEVASFYLSKVPVTNQQFEAYDPGFERAKASPGDGDPAVGVSYRQAEEYCRWYAELSRKPMRLPTEREWDYACRGGSEDPGWAPDPERLDDHAWHAGNSGGRVPPLDAKRYNPCGLYGMLGGVWDWTSTAADRDAPAPRRIQRGGSFRTPRAEIACGLRRAADPDAGFDDVGFRVVKPLRR